MSSPIFWLDYISYPILPMLLYVHKLLTHIYYLCIREVSLIKSCLAPLFLTCFFLSRISLSGEYSFVSKGEKILSKEKHSFRGSNNFLVFQLVLIDKSFMRASLICFLCAFNVFLFGG
jgi:hypothetical protein